MAAALTARKQCTVDGIDTTVAVEPGLNEFYLHDLNAGLPQLEFEKYDYVLMLDVIEHLARPETFLDQLRQAFGSNPDAEILISTANIGFFIPRLMLLIGQFNYGRRGILDMTHTRLYTFSSFERVVAAVGLRHPRAKGGAGPVSHGARRQLLQPVSAEGEPYADPNLARFVFLSDHAANQAPANAGAVTENSGGALKTTRRVDRGT